MHLHTKYLGEVEIDASKIIQFPVGLPGFIDETEFALVDFPDNPIFQVLQSVKSVNTAFIVTNPYHFYHDYSFELDDSIVESLEVKSEKDVMVVTIVTLKNPFNTSTLNLKAPVIINPSSKQGKQYILNMDNIPAKAPISPGNHLKAGGE
ncbi:flagellar assembly factor FliW [Virgibacillus natechei]|uniref:Flagellar assembly factor FliW n=1 Tax=Virgibacillus natechei TaxID=1216297 RepID=A0ABS4IJY2_9BACI|nr:flagellar assembly protein FliW [Virgibacillus natechei]MBP1971168.1 flagellar assembly factor FliW [Virgibacillus natechei]UZD11915.1 flagellar assembly protein FliW [Virgibacillus natechei]